MAEHELTCRACGVQFNYHRRKAYCSRRCRPSKKLKGTDPHANAVCRQDHICLMCDKVFKPKHADRTKFCGRECGLAWTGIQAKARSNGGRVFVRSLRNQKIAKPRCDHPLAPAFCCSCGSGYYRTEPYQRYCTELCGEKAQIDATRRHRRASKLVRKARKRTAGPVERIDPIKVFERDGWRCGICGLKTHRAKRGSHHAKAPELDHIVAIANGGTHTWDNVQCSCRQCNGIKGATDYGQIPLFAKP